MYVESLEEIPTYPIW